MSATIQTVFWGATKLGLVALGAFYVFAVLTTYATDGPRYRLRLDLVHPARSAGQLVVWMGVKAISAMVHAARSTLEVLCEASADVGGWVVSKSGPQVQARVRSRFL